MIWDITQKLNKMQEKWKEKETNKQDENQSDVTDEWDTLYVTTAHSQNNKQEWCFLFIYE